MQIVIEIDEKILQQAKHYHDLPYDDYVIHVAEAIATGTPLPKGHGRLIDADRLIRDEVLPHLYHLKNGDTAIPIIDIKHAPTIIEAEVEE